jgi:hypothetical protein
VARRFGVCSSSPCRLIRFVLRTQARSPDRHSMDEGHGRSSEPRTRLPAIPLVVMSFLFVPLLGFAAHGARAYATLPCSRSSSQPSLAVSEFRGDGGRPQTGRSAAAPPSSSAGPWYSCHSAFSDKKELSCLMTPKICR